MIAIMHVPHRFSCIASRAGRPRALSRRRYDGVAERLPSGLPPPEQTSGIGRNGRRHRPGSGYIVMPKESESGLSPVTLAAADVRPATDVRPPTVGPPAAAARPAAGARPGTGTGTGTAHPLPARLRTITRGTV